MEASTIEAESVSLWPMYLDDLAIQLVVKWLEHIEPFLTGMSQITRFFHLEKKMPKVSRASQNPAQVKEYVLTHESLGEH